MNKPIPEDPPSTTPPLGEVRHDERGQAVWHWAADTARNAVQSTSQLLRKLDLSQFSLEDDKPTGPTAGDAEPPKPDVPRVFNPYTPAEPAAPARPAARVKPSEPAPRAARARRPVSAAPRLSWWRRLLGLG